MIFSCLYCAVYSPNTYSCLARPAKFPHWSQTFLRIAVNYVANENEFCELAHRMNTEIAYSQKMLFKRHGIDNLLQRNVMSIDNSKKNYFQVSCHLSRLSIATQNLWIFDIWQLQYFTLHVNTGTASYIELDKSKCE